MKKLFSAGYNADAFNIALLILRLGSGILMASHGYDKLIQYNEMKVKFMSFIGLSPAITLGLVIFAELVCAILVAIGLFTRLACIPLIILLCVALFQVHNADFFGEGQVAVLYLVIYVTLLFTGPGKFSIDHIITGKKHRNY